jgi:hypothetical protein
MRQAAIGAEPGFDQLQHRQLGMRLDSLSNHGYAVSKMLNRLFAAWLALWHEDNFVQIGLFKRLEGKRYVTDVYWIKRASKNTDAFLKLQ